MERQHPPPQENKLLLLYIFDKVGAMTNLQSLRFAIENDIMDYLDLQLTLAELTESGYVQALLVDDRRFYTLTTQARETLSYFRKHIPASRRAWVDEIAPLWREKFRKERMMTADYRRNGEGDYTVYLAAREAGKTLIDLRLGVTSLERAKALCLAWEDRSADAYRALMEALLRSGQDGSSSEDQDSISIP